MRSAVVLGCSNLSQDVTTIFLSWRIASVAKLYKASKIQCIIVSGDNHIASYDEPTDMKQSLVKAGVPE